MSEATVVDKRWTYCPECGSTEIRHAEGDHKQCACCLQEWFADIVEGREARVHRMPPGPDRWKERSRTFHGIAEAMAQQWGNALSRREK